MKSIFYRFVKLSLIGWALTMPIYATASYGRDASAVDKVFDNKTSKNDALQASPVTQDLNNEVLNNERFSNEAPDVGKDLAPTDQIPTVRETPFVHEYKGRITCEKLNKSKVYTNDARFVPFCSDALKGCFVQEQLRKLPDTHPLHQELDGRLVDHLSFNLGFCEIALLTYAPKLYHDEFKR